MTATSPLILTTLAALLLAARGLPARDSFSIGAFTASLIALVLELVTLTGGLR